MENGTTLLKPTAAEWDFIIQLADIFGIKVYSDTRDKRNNPSYPNLHYNGQISNNCAHSKPNDQEDMREYPPVTLRKFIRELIAVVPDPKVKLNDQCTAEINSNVKSVVIGRQTFSFDKVKELYEATLV